MPKEDRTVIANEKRNKELEKAKKYTERLNLLDRYRGSRWISRDHPELGSDCESIEEDDYPDLGLALS